MVYFSPVPLGFFSLNPHAVPLTADSCGFNLTKESNRSMVPAPSNTSKFACNYTKRNGEQCRRQVHLSGSKCWQHASGLSDRWNSLTKNQTVTFLGLVLGLVLTAVGIYIGLRSSQAAGFVQLGYVRFRNTQFVAGDRLAMNVWIKNAGGRPIENVYLVFSASLVPLNGVGDEIDRLTRTGFRKQALSNYGRMLNEDQKGIVLGKGEGLWDTLVLPKDSEPPLSQEQVDEIMRGRYRLYVNAWVRWKDSPHDFELCEWLQPPETNHIDNEQLIWHLCAN